MQINEDNQDSFELQMTIMKTLHKNIVGEPPYEADNSQIDMMLEILVNCLAMTLHMYIEDRGHSYSLDRIKTKCLEKTKYLREVDEKDGIS